MGQRTGPGGLRTHGQGPWKGRKDVQTAPGAWWAGERAEKQAQVRCEDGAAAGGRGLQEGDDDL